MHFITSRNSLLLSFFCFCCGSHTVVDTISAVWTSILHTHKLEEHSPPLTSRMDCVHSSATPDPWASAVGVRGETRSQPNGLIDCVRIQTLSYPTIRNVGCWNMHDGNATSLGVPMAPSILGTDATYSMRCVITQSTSLSHGVSVSIQRCKLAIDQTCSKHSEWWIRRIRYP